MVMLRVENLSISFSSYSFGLRRRTVQVIHDLSLELDGGKILAVVGQSGGGKSLLAHALIGILPRNSSWSGTIRFKDEPLTAKRIAALRGREIALVPQSIVSLNPLLHVGTQIARAAKLSGYRNGEALQSRDQALDRYGLARKVAQFYPFQLSGGMARRVLVATATVGRADLLVADEPTNGLDGKAATEALGHLRELADTGKAVLLITHDIEAALTVADEVVVIRDGTVVEQVPAEAFRNAEARLHPYTRALWQALPRNAFWDENSERSLPARSQIREMTDEQMDNQRKDKEMGLHYA